MYTVIYDAIYGQSGEQMSCRPNAGPPDRIKAYIISKQGILACVFLKDWSQGKSIQVWNSQKESVVMVYMEFTAKLLAKIEWIDESNVRFGGSTPYMYKYGQIMY